MQFKPGQTVPIFDPNDPLNFQNFQNNNNHNNNTNLYMQNSSDNSNSSSNDSDNSNNSLQQQKHKPIKYNKYNNNNSNFVPSFQIPKNRKPYGFAPKKRAKKATKKINYATGLLMNAPNPTQNDVTPLEYSDGMPVIQWKMPKFF